MSAPAPAPEYTAVPGSDARKDPVRLLVLQGEARPAVAAADEPVVMTFPHLLLRELIAFLCLSLGLVLMALFFDAPLEEIANPERTPNPAKAPWYFLGLQELLHYYPPLVSGVILPGLVVTALAVIPYFDVNIERHSMWPAGRRRRRVAAVAIVAAALTAVFLFTGAHAVWPIIGPLWLVGVVMCLPIPWVRARSLDFWIFLWFLLSAVCLTTIGVFFRGPGWELILPWREGVY